MSRRPLIIAIDGPSASGKGTLAKRLAEHFGLPHLDTGLLYRAVGWLAEQTGRPPGEIAASLRLSDIDNPELKSDQAGQAGSKVAAIPEVRANLLNFQKNFAYRESGAVLDGRDIGTVICPGASEVVRDRQYERTCRTPVPGVARTGCRHYKTARSCRDGGAGPSRQRTGGSTFESRTRCLPSRYQRHGCRCGFRRGFGVHSAQGLSFCRAVSRRRPTETFGGDCGRTVTSGGGMSGSGSAGLNRLADGRQRFARGSLKERS